MFSHAGTQYSIVRNLEHYLSLFSENEKGTKCLSIMSLLNLVLMETGWSIVRKMFIYRYSTISLFAQLWSRENGVGVTRENVFFSIMVNIFDNLKIIEERLSHHKI